AAGRPRPSWPPSCTSCQTCTSGMTAASSSVGEVAREVAGDVSGDADCAVARRGSSEAAAAIVAAEVRNCRRFTRVIAPRDAMPVKTDVTHSTSAFLPNTTCMRRSLFVAPAAIVLLSSLVAARARAEFPTTAPYPAIHY